MDKTGDMKALKESLKGIQERLASSRQEAAAIIGEMEYVNAGRKPPLSSAKWNM